MNFVNQIAMGTSSDHHQLANCVTFIILFTISLLIGVDPHNIRIFIFQFGIFSNEHRILITVEQNWRTHNSLAMKHC